MLVNIFSQIVLRPKIIMVKVLRDRDAVSMQWQTGSTTPFFGLMDSIHNHALSDLPPVIRPPVQLVAMFLESVAYTPAHYVVDTCCTAYAIAQ